MASATRLPLKSIAFTTALVVAAGSSRINLRALLTSTFTGPGSYSRIAALLVVVANLKNVPFAWHVSSSSPCSDTPPPKPYAYIYTKCEIKQYRVFNAILRHCVFCKRIIPPELAPSTLFLPVITSSRSPLSECDYNFHKSNSTYFSDLDVTRSHLVCCLLQPGIARLHHNAQEKLVLDAQGNPVLGRWGIMLGGVQCSFKREIGIYEPFEMWTRMLCWDRKWLYVVTHFVKKGTVRPRSYILTDGSWFGSKPYDVKGDGKAAPEEEDVDEKNIFASAVSKYVVKLGRLTVHPEVLLAASGMLPERPGGWATMNGNSGDSTPEIVEAGAGADADAAPASSSGDEWDWKRIVAQNERGLKFAEHLAALDGLHHEFSGSKAPALGRYRDFIF